MRLNLATSPDHISDEITRMARTVSRPDRSSVELRRNRL